MDAINAVNIIALLQIIALRPSVMCHSKYAQKHVTGNKHQPETAPTAAICTFSCAHLAQCCSSYLSLHRNCAKSPQEGFIR